MKQIINDYNATNPTVTLPKSIQQSIQWDTFRAALVEDDYDMFVLRRTRNPVREVTGMQYKLSLRPDLAPVVNWCMAWIMIRAAHRQGVLPTFENSKSAWTSEQAKNPTNHFFNGPITPKYASDPALVTVGQRSLDSGGTGYRGRRG